MDIPEFSFRFQLQTLNFLQKKYINLFYGKYPETRNLHYEDQYGELAIAPPKTCFITKNQLSAL